MLWLKSDAAKIAVFILKMYCIIFFNTSFFGKILVSYVLHEKYAGLNSPLSIDIILLKCDKKSGFGPVRKWMPQCYLIQETLS